MNSRYLKLAVAVFFLCSSPSWSFARAFGRDATHTEVHVFDVDAKSDRIVFESDERFDAPSWSADGTYLVMNSQGKLWRVPLGGRGKPQPIQTGRAGWIDIDHGTSPDGKTVAFSAGGALSLVPVEGGTPRQLAVSIPSYFHGWSPRGDRIVYSGNRGGGTGIYEMDLASGVERRLAPERKSCDAPSYSSDGAWVYFQSPDSGASEIWRVATATNAPAPERVLGDDREDSTPRPSPDGKWLFYLSYSRHTQGHPADRDVILRALPLAGSNGTPAKTLEVARFVGGHGSLGKRPWSPNGKLFAYSSYAPPPPAVHIVLFTPSDLAAPPEAAHRLTQIADAAEKFLFDGMRKWGYTPAATNLFRREAEGSVEILRIQGEQSVASGRYARPNYANELIDRASQKYHIFGEGHIWWLFIYLGDRPVRFDDWRGSGCSRDGGWAMVNYDTIPGELRSDVGLNEGFNAQYFLKGTIHELGHAFGLPHIGPDLSLGLGNSLMGPNNSVYAARHHPKADQVYLTEAAAAMLWKHPRFSLDSNHRFLQPAVKLLDFQARFNSSANRVELSGKITADQHAHTVVVIDDQGTNDEYWCESHSARVGADGSFQVRLNKPAKTAGHYRILFCFDNGMVTGDGLQVGFDNRGPFRKSYSFHDGTFETTD